MEYLRFAVDGLTVGAVYALIALGFYLIITSTGVLDFAHGEKVVLGGLIVLSLSGGLFRGSAISGIHSPIVLPFAIAIVAAVAIGLVLGLLYDRLIIAPTIVSSEIVPIMATLGAALFLFYGHGIVWGQDGFPFPAFTEGQLRTGTLVIAYQSFWVLGVVFAVLGGLHLFFQYTTLGKAMVAAATNAVAASAVGISVARMRAYAFGISFGLAILAGVLISPITLAGGTLGTSLALKGFAGAVLGGLSNPLGVVAGSLLVGVLEHVISGAIGYGYRDPVVYFLLIAVLLFRPAGLFGARRGRAA